METSRMCHSAPTTAKLHLNIHHSDELSWTIQAVETSLLHQLTHDLIGYLSEMWGRVRDTII